VSDLAELGLACDLRRTPAGYPGPRAPHAGLLVGDRYEALPGGLDQLGDALARHGAVPLAGRTAVVAVGSNAAPGVLRRKFGATVVPFLPMVVRGLGAGHSAHVSVPGFVAAAPFAAPGLVIELVVSLFDEAQLAVLDATEPNYTRCVVAASADGWDGLLSAYDSHWGVIAEPGGAPVPLATQADLLARLRQRWEPYPHVVGPTAEPAAVLAGWAASEKRRRRAREELAATGWARPSGLARPADI
jgi:hypothetical protein